MAIIDYNSNRPRGQLLPSRKLKFLDQCREVMRFKHLSYRTEETYIQWIRRFILFHRQKVAPHPPSPESYGGTSPDHKICFDPHNPHPTCGHLLPIPQTMVGRGEGGIPCKWTWRHPKDMGEPEVRAFLTDLAVRRGVVAATQNQAFRVNRFAPRGI